MNNKGVLLLHGLTGTPANMAPVSAALSDRGYLVKAPLIAGHGTSPKALAKSSRNDWFASVEKAYKELCSDLNKSGKQGDSPKIFCAGLSLGSLLALELALYLEEKSTPLAGIACLATPLKLSKFTEAFLLPISHIPLVKCFIKFTSKKWELGVFEPIGRAIYQNSSLQKTPVASAHELQKLQREIIPQLPNLKTPIIVIHAAQDSIAPIVNLKLLANIASGAVKRTITLEASGHVITLDAEKDLVAESVCDFFDSL